MSIFKRIFRVTQAEAHAVVDKLEDPIRMTEQGIRDLKSDLQKAMTSLAEVKSLSLRTRREADNKKKLAADYERKAMLLLQKAQSGDMEMADAERLATESLGKKESTTGEAVRQSQEASHHEQMAAQLQVNVNKIKSTVQKYENDLVTLRARARTAAATKKINKQLAQVDSSGTIAMLEKMRSKVEEDESLSAAYGDLASADTSVEDEIDAALGGTEAPAASASLEELKKKMGIAGG